jgi:aminopeptidase N
MRLYAVLSLSLSKAFTVHKPYHTFLPQVKESMIHSPHRTSTAFQAVCSPSRFLPFLLLCGLVLLRDEAHAQTSFPPSVPYNPHIDVLHYTFQLELNDTNNRIRGEASIELAFKSANVQAFHLDLLRQQELRQQERSAFGMTVLAVQEGTRPVRFVQDSSRLIIYPASQIASGEQRRYTVAYQGIPADGLIIGKNKFGQRTFFGDNWPNRARHWLPTVDHPSDKATCEFIVTAPHRYQVVANGLLVEESDVDSLRRRTQWRESTPIATKLMVIGVAQFAVQHLRSQRGIPVESWVFPQNRDSGLFDYAQAAPILDFFEQHIGGFAYEKLANVQSKTRYGGMENASAIFYSEDAVDGKRSNERLFAHEIAHQWFGDAVSESDWPHVWLSEGFATYLTDVYLEFRYGRDRIVENMNRERERVLRYTREHPSAPIVDTSAVNFATLLGPLTYEKAAWVLHGLRRVVGDDAFWSGLRSYYARFKNGNASTNDFKRVMEEASGQDLTRFFRQWLFQPGHPVLQYSWSYDAAAKSVKLRIRQAQANPFETPVDIGLVTRAASTSATTSTSSLSPPRVTTTLHTIRLREREQTFTIPFDTAPVELVIDPHSWLLCEREQK